MTTVNPFTRATEIADQKATAILSKPGRKPAKIPEIIDAEATLDQPRFENAMSVMRTDQQSVALAESQHAATVRAIAQQVGYQLPAECVDADLIQRDISANMRRSVEACLEVGRGLTVLKAACQHGEFTARLEVLNIDKHVASRFMQAAVKFSKLPSSATLKAIGNQSKLFEMLVLDDEQIEELELTGQSGELKLDDVATMSVRDLRKRVRELMLEKQADEERIAVRGQQRDEAEEKARGFKNLPHDEQVDALLAEATNLTNAALTAINGRFRQALVALENHGQSTSGTKDFRPLAAGLVGQLQQAVTIIRDEFMLADIIGDGTPEWMRATAHLIDGE